MRRTDGKRNGRGPYLNIEILKEEDRRQTNVLADPEVAAFASAYLNIRDPKNRACIEWLVRRLSDEQPE